MGACMSASGKKKVLIKKVLHVLLLGIGGSGKSTFCKQMQIIHQGDLDPEVAKTYRGVLLTNIILGLKAIGSKKQDLENTENYKKSRWILSLDENIAKWDDELIERIKSLWDDEGVRETWAEIKDGFLIQLDYLMENFNRYLDPTFIPNSNDILRARQRTTGGESYYLEEEKVRWELTDVGGQFSERTKWNMYFTEKPPQAVIFFLALDEYNIPNTELKTEKCDTKFELALDVFKEYMCSGPVIEYKICRIVFLNKVDLFTEKIKEDKKWDDFTAKLGYTGERTVSDSIKYIEDRLRSMDVNNDDDDSEELWIHQTNALDTVLMTKISNQIKVSILSSAMKLIGLL